MFGHYLRKIWTPIIHRTKRNAYTAPDSFSKEIPPFKSSNNNNKMALFVSLTGNVGVFSYIIHSEQKKLDADEKYEPQIIVF